MPFYFAWCDAGQAFDRTVLREDEVIMSFDIAHLEGQLPTLDIEIRNPHVGLLAPGRHQWASLAWGAPDGTTTQLFYGRLIALPSNLLSETVTLKFVARPVDYLAQKQAVAETLKVSPFYDPIWINQNMFDDPDTILETYTYAWHVDRFSEGVTVSDIIFGEDGVEEFQEIDSFYDSVSISFSQSPQNEVIFDGKVEWTQAAVGLIQVPATNVSALNSAQIIADTPAPGTQLGSGWSVSAGTAATSLGEFQKQNDPGLQVNIQLKNFEPVHFDGDLLTYSLTATGFMTGVVVNITGSGTAGNPDYGVAAEWHLSETWRGVKGVPNSGSGAGNVPNTSVGLAFQYQMQRGRTEVVKFVMVSDLQPIVTMPEDAPFNPINLSMQGSDVNLALAGGDSPLGDPGRSAFFPTDRGLQSIIYPMLVARAHLLQSARAVKVSFDCAFERALGLSCRKNVLLHDHRLPGGQIIGKITEYHIKVTGDSGQLIGTVQLESTIGTGAAPAIAVPGTPTYSNDGYVEDYQFYQGALIALPTDDMTFAIPASFRVDDGLVTPLTVDQVLNTFTVHHGSTLDDIASQVGVGATVFDPQLKPDDPATIKSVSAPSIENQWNDIANANAKFDQAVQNAVQTNPTWLQIQLAPVSGQSYHAEYDLGISFLTVPKLVDLAAPSA